MTFQIQIVLTERTGVGGGPPYDFSEMTRTDPVMEFESYAESLAALGAIKQHFEQLKTARIQRIFASAKQDWEISRFPNWSYEDYMVEAWAEVSRSLKGELV